MYSNALILVVSLHIKKHCAAKSTWFWPVCTAPHCLQWRRPCQQFAAGTMSSFPLSPALPPFPSSLVYACISPYSSRFRGKELGSYPTKPSLVPRKGTEQRGTAMNCKGLMSLQRHRRSAEKQDPKRERSLAWTESGPPVRSTQLGRSSSFTKGERPYHIQLEAKTSTLLYCNTCYFIYRKYKIKNLVYHCLQNKNSIQSEIQLPINRGPNERARLLLLFFWNDALDNM